MTTCKHPRAKREDRALPAWRGLVHGAGFGIGAGALGDLVPTLVDALDPILRAAAADPGPGTLALALCLAAITGFFFETSPPRMGS